MGLFNHFKKEENAATQAKPEVKPVVDNKTEPVKKPTVKSTTAEVKDEVKRQAPVKKEKDAKVIKGKTDEAHRILIKPLVTEKAAEFSAVGKYIFVINPRMNKIEVKKAVRKIYGVDPVRVNIINVSGNKVRYGRITGRTKSWKKAVVTLKPGDKIEIYEGV